MLAWGNTPVPASAPLVKRGALELAAHLRVGVLLEGNRANVVDRADVAVGHGPHVPDVNEIRVIHGPEGLFEDAYAVSEEPVLLVEVRR